MGNLRTGFALVVFAATLTAASDAHRAARRAMDEARQTTNPVRLLILGMQVKESLDDALRADPENVQIRLDLVRFYMTAPGIIGGDHGNARTEAAEIARRDAALGSFAQGYIFYRTKEYGAGRLELREAIRTAREPATKALAMKWLGWLSQETQQWDEAFAMFEELRTSDASALYEIGRTSAFCRCRLERGKTSLESYIASRPAKGMPTVADARKQLKTVRALLNHR